MNEYKRILVVARMIQSCKTAIQYGVSLAEKYGADLYVIHSIHNPFGLKGWGLGTRALAVEYEKSVFETKRKLANLVEVQRKQGMSIKEMVREGEPTEEILKTIKEEKIDLLVLLAHEEGRLEHFLFGRSNEELVRKMPCSLMLVKKEPGESVEGEEDALS
ncbi:MAG: universal stress protein [Desulfobulbaceae bacterium]|uniref:Universal stress protein n=1 Tax=Candidatus Desulfobia pelagia TaxID=2841692 RepID=A0A8J6N9Z2_9BACT|nr:universal stress protein [Candidatus Desulfobia pelagia]